MDNKFGFAHIVSGASAIGPSGVIGKFQLNLELMEAQLVEVSVGLGFGSTNPYQWESVPHGCQTSLLKKGIQIPFNCPMPICWEGDILMVGDSPIYSCPLEAKGEGQPPNKSKWILANTGVKWEKNPPMWKDGDPIPVITGVSLGYCDVFVLGFGPVQMKCKNPGPFQLYQIYENGGGRGNVQGNRYKIIEGEERVLKHLRTKQWGWQLLEEEDSL